MDQIERIQEMERVLDASEAVLKKLSEALEDYASMQGQMQALFDYYFGPLWREDCEADSAGRLPPGLKRGVLSEDAVFDLFTENQSILKQFQQLLEAHKKYPD